MFIIKFNKMIRNKWIWGAFAIIVAGAFALTDVRVADKSAAGGAGVLNDEPVSAEEFNTCRNLVNFMRRTSGANSGDMTVERETWQIVAALRTARALGISATDKEVGDLVVSQLKMRDGKFDMKFAQQILEAEGYTIPMFEEFVRREIILARLRRSVSEAAWEAPSVLADAAAGFNDVFTVTPVIVKNDFEPASIEISDETLTSYYEKNNERYRVPDQVAVRYVEFKADDYTSGVEVAEADLIDYYDANSHLYVTKDTNGLETVTPFEDVRSEIRNIFVKDAAARGAYNAAGEFADRFYNPQGDTVVPKFGAAAEELGRAVVTTGLFSADAAPIAASGASDFSEAAFLLIPDETCESISDAVYCGDKSYVMALSTNVPSYIPELESVRAAVLEEVRLEEAARLFNARLAAVSEAFALGIGKGSNFVEIAKGLDLTVGTNLSFSVLSSHKIAADTPYVQEIAMKMSGMDAGAVSDPIDIQDGAVIFQVMDRMPATDKTEDSIDEEQIAGIIVPRKAALLWKSWLAANLASMKFVTDMDLDGPNTPLPDETDLAE